MHISYLSSMAVHVPHIYKEGIYFIRFTCHRWLPLLALSDGYEAVYNFFTVLQQKGHTLVGYVIMPNHIHMLLHYNGGNKV